MAVEILLTSEAYVKTVTAISDNLAGKYMLTSIREAQEQGLRSILGDCLLDTLKAMSASGSINDEANGAYKTLVERCQDYLAYMSVVEALNKVSYKVTNFGVTKSTDQNLQVSSQDEIVKQLYYYQAKADACCYRLQNYLLDNRTSYPELDECTCRRIKSNLYSAATCGLWLGGARGREGRKTR